MNYNKVIIGKKYRNKINWQSRQDRNKQNMKESLKNNWKIWKGKKELKKKRKE